MHRSIEKLKMLIDVKTFIGILATVISITGSAVFLYAQIKFNNERLEFEMQANNKIIIEKLTTIEKSNEKVIAEHVDFKGQLAYVMPTLERLLTKVGF